MILSPKVIQLTSFVPIPICEKCKMIKLFQTYSNYKYSKSDDRKSDFLHLITVILNLRTDFYPRGTQHMFTFTFTETLVMHQSVHPSSNCFCMTHVTEMPAAHFSNCLKHQMVIWAVSNHPKMSEEAETVGDFTNSYRELQKWHVYEGSVRSLGSPGISHQQTFARTCKKINKLRHLILKSCCQVVLLRGTCAVFIPCQLLHPSCQLGKKKHFCQPDIINFKKGIFLDLTSPCWCHWLTIDVQTGRQFSVWW